MIHKRFRIEPFILRDKWYATVFIEYLGGDERLVSSHQFVLTAEEFDELKEAVLQADNSGL